MLRRFLIVSCLHSEFRGFLIWGFCYHLVEIEDVITPRKITLFKYKSWTEQRIRCRQKCRYFEDICFSFRGRTQINSKRGEQLHRSLCAFKDTFLQRENFHCTGHATMSIDRGKTIVRNASLALYTIYHDERFWNWLGKKKCPGARLDLTVNFHQGHFIDPTNCPWVFEDEWIIEKARIALSEVKNLIMDLSLKVYRFF